MVATVDISIFKLGQLSHVTLLQVVQMVVITEVYTIIYMSLLIQFKVKQIVYSKSCSAAYLLESTICFDAHLMKQLVLRRVACCCLLLSIKDE
jgi:hypothetical protein